MRSKDYLRYAPRSVIMRHMCILSLLLNAAILPLRVSAQAANTGRSTPPVAAREQTLLPADLTTRVVALSFKEATMEEVIASLAKQSGRSILVRDTPRVDKADLVFTGNLRDALNKTADAYDYTWTLGKHNVLLFNKRFSRQEEYPSLLPGEVRQTAQDMKAILNAFNFAPDTADDVALIRAVYNAMTPEQTAFLKSGQRLSARQLTDAQRQCLQQAILSNLLSQPYYKWSVLLWLPEGLADASLTSFLRLDSRTAALPEPLGDMPAGSLLELWMLNYVIVDKHGTQMPVTIVTTESPSTKPSRNAPKSQEIRP